MSDSDDVTVQLVDLPVVFRYGAQERRFDRQPDGKGGGGALGVWRVGNQAWKIFSKTTSLAKNRGYYQTAQTNHLPIGIPPPTFQEGTVTEGTKRPTQGYAIISQWLDGREFNFQVSQGAFKQALEIQGISHSRSSAQYQQVLAACHAADTVHLIDVQGKVNGAAGVPQALAFFDINLAATYSGQAATLVEVITAWGTHP